MENNTNQIPKNLSGSAGGVGGTEADDVQPQHNSCSDNENAENEFEDYGNMGGGKTIQAGSG